MRSHQILTKLSTVCFTNEQHLLLSNLKLLVLETLIYPIYYLSSYEIECLITSIATL